MKLERAERNGRRCSREWNFPKEISNIDLVVALTIQAEAGKNPNRGKKLGQLHRKVGQSTKKVTHVQLLLFSTLQGTSPLHSSNETGEKP